MIFWILIFQKKKMESKSCNKTSTDPVNSLPFKEISKKKKKKKMHTGSSKLFLLFLRPRY